MEFALHETYRKIPVVGRLDLEIMWMQIQNISKYSPKVNFEISHPLESSVLNLLDP